MTHPYGAGTSAEEAGQEREEIILTVSEGKRLIGMGVAALPVVQARLAGRRYRTSRAAAPTAMWRRRSWAGRSTGSASRPA